MKWGLIVGGVVILAAAAYFLLMQPYAQTTSQTPTDTASQGPSTDSGQAKINIDAVCQGALAYMTFPTGLEAEAFVEECKQGKHPEVIDKYKADLNLGAGAAI